MLFSLLVYTIVPIMMSLLAWNYQKRNAATVATTGKELPFFSWEIVSIIVIFSCVAGARYYNGVDYPTYLKEFEYLQHSAHPFRQNFEVGFVFISRLIAQSGLHYFFYFALWACMQITFVYYALRWNKSVLVIIPFIIMMGTFYLSWMNGIRQCIVECLFIVLVEVAEKKKIWLYIGLLLLASLMHKSSIILIPFYFLLFKDYKLYNRYVCLAILAVCVILGNSPSWLTLMDNTSDFLTWLGYEDYSDKIEDITTKNLRTMAWGPSRLGVFIADVLVIFFYGKMQDGLVEEKYHARLDHYFILFFIGTCLYNLFANTSHLFLRPVSYFSIFRLPMYAFLILYFRKSAHTILYYLAICLICSNIYISHIKHVVSPEWTTEACIYKVFWSHGKIITNNRR